MNRGLHFSLAYNVSPRGRLRNMLWKLGIVVCYVRDVSTVAALPFLLSPQHTTPESALVEMTMAQRGLHAEASVARVNTSFTATSVLLDGGPDLRRGVVEGPSATRFLAQRLRVAAQLRARRDSAVEEAKTNATGRAHTHRRACLRVSRRPRSGGPRSGPRALSVPPSLLRCARVHERG